MLIQVQHSDKRFDYVKGSMLQDLIELNEISKFRRTSGWVTIGVDPIRKMRRANDSMLLRDSRGILSRPFH